MGKRNFQKFVINSVKEISFRNSGIFIIHFCSLYFNFFLICTQQLNARKHVFRNTTYALKCIIFCNMSIFLKFSIIFSHLSCFLNSQKNQYFGKKNRKDLKKIWGIRNMLNQFLTLKFLNIFFKFSIIFSHLPRSLKSQKD